VTIEQVTRTGSQTPLPQKHGPHFMKTKHATKDRAVTCAVLASSLSSATLAANPPAAKVIEAQRRMDTTGAGSYHRIGLLRELHNTRENLARKQKASPVEKKVRVSKS